MVDNRRGAHRFPLQLPVQVRVTSPSWSARTAGRTRDISSTGLYFFSPQKFAAGSVVEVVVTLPQRILPRGEAQVKCQGRVLRVDAAPTGGPAMSGVATSIEGYDFLHPMQ
ncbi:MAG: PilZ domain-containing protein [Candidatus Acidiferrales bacterium]